MRAKAGRDLLERYYTFDCVEFNLKIARNLPFDFETTDTHQAGSGKKILTITGFTAKCSKMRKVFQIEKNLDSGIKPLLVLLIAAIILPGAARSYTGRK